MKAGDARSRPLLEKPCRVAQDVTDKGLREGTPVLGARVRPDRSRRRERDKERSFQSRSEQDVHRSSLSKVQSDNDILR